MNKIIYKALRFGNYVLADWGLKSPKKVNNAFYVSFKTEQDAKRAVNKVLKDIKDLEGLINQLENKRKLTREGWQDLKIQVINIKKDYEPKIKKLNKLQYDAYLKMKEKFEEASETWNKGNRAGAKPLSEKGHEYEAEAKKHTADRKALQKEILELELKRDKTYAKLLKIEGRISDSKTKIADLGTKDLKEAEENYKKSKEDYKTLQQINSVAQLSSVVPEFSVIALKEFDDYYHNEYLPSKIEKIKGQKPQKWTEDDGTKVRVKNGFHRDYGCYTTDIVLTPPGVKDGLHFHIAFSEFGEKLFNHWKTNK